VAAGDAALSRTARSRRKHEPQRKLLGQRSCRNFFSTLKRELDDKTFESRESARAELFEYIEIWYNRKRRHSTLGYVSPERFEQDQAA
jgi:putative transposase